MALYTYEKDIPEATHNPSADQPDMKINTNSIYELIDEDHISFEQNNGGLHRQVRLPVHGTPPGTPPGSIPVGLVVNEGTIYTKTAGGESQLFYTPDASGNEYQLTRTITGSFATTFAQNASYGTPPAGVTQTGGWSFLPGNLLFQYGFFGKPASTPTTGQIEFPTPFTNPPFSINISTYNNSSGNSGTLIIDSLTPPTKLKFNYRMTGVFDGIFWMAIGV